MISSKKYRYFIIAVFLSFICLTKRDIEVLVYSVVCMEWEYGNSLLILWLNEMIPSLLSTRVFSAYLLLFHVTWNF